MLAEPASSAEAPRVTATAFTVWSGRESRRTEFGDGTSAPGWREALELRKSVLWLEMALEADPTLWINPWDDSAFPRDWSPFGQVADLLGLRSPQIKPKRLALLEVVLNRLPRINELGELQWLEAEVESHGSSVQALPLAGFRPTSTLQGDNADKGDRGDQGDNGDLLELLLLRVNLAVWDRYVLTVRLPDRLCSGTPSTPSTPSEDGGHRIPAPPCYSEKVLTAQPERYLGPGERPSAIEVGQAVALYLSATCACVAEYARRELAPVERQALHLLEGGANDSEEGANDASRPDGLTADSEGTPQPEVVADSEGTPQPEVLAAPYRRIFATRGALQVAEEELGRLSQRQFEITIPDDDFRHATRRRYERALEDVQTAESELRLAGDALTHRLDTWQLEQSAQQGKRSESVQRLLAVLGTLLVAATLVASVFQDQYKIPHPKSLSALIGMVLLMTGTAGLLALVFVASKPRIPRHVQRLRWVPEVLPTALAALPILAVLLIGAALVANAR